VSGERDPRKSILKPSEPRGVYPSSVTRIPSAAAVRRHYTRRSLTRLALVVPILLLGVIIAIGLKRATSPQGAVTPTAPIIYVTATDPPPTFVLPAEYILALTATAPPTYIATQAEVSSPPAFITATPAFNLWRTKIVYVCYVNGSDEICLMDADGSNQLQLTRRPGTDWYPSLSPDGESIVFSSQSEDGNFDIYIMSTSGGNIQRLTRHMGDNYSPSISPDGRRIVFTSTAGGEQDIWVMGIDGSNPTRLTWNNVDDVDPEWSPDGTRISFTSNLAGATSLFVMNADGTNIRQLTYGINVEGRNDWSPDGRYLAFYAGPPGDKDIYLVHIDCANLSNGCDRSLLRRLTNGGNNKAPSFSPDGQWIAYASNASGKNQIFIIRVDGGEVRQLTFDDHTNWQPRWGP
jgi:Tol biopolymer transport system component